MAGFQRHSLLQTTDPVKVDDVYEAGRKSSCHGHFFAQIFVTERQRDLGFLDDHGKFMRAQEWQGADGNGAGLDHTEPTSGQHRCVGGAEQHPVARHHAQIFGENLGHAIGSVL